MHEFGEFRLDLRKGLVFRRGEPVALPPKAFETLIAFLESDGRVISKEELMTRVWGDTFVEENNLTQQISTLRKLLGASAIETVPRRGYRFAMTRAAETRQPKRPPLHWLIVLSVLVVLSVLFVLVLPTRNREMPRTIAVLPFKPLVPASADPYLELGMADALITELSNVHQMTVRPTSSVIMYTTAADPSAIGEKLGVEAVLDGRIQHIGDRVRVTAQLVRVRDRTPLWAGKFDEEAKNILAMQDAISNRIVSALMLDLSGDDQRTLGKPATQNQEAYQLYLRGRYHWFHWTPEEWTRAQDSFEQAVAKDPNFALAWSGLADAIGVQLWFRRPKDVAPRARAAVERALTLDDRLPEAYASRGAQTMFYEWDRAAAERDLTRAIALNPNQALNHDLHALLLASGGKFAEALQESRRALALDPTSPYMNTDLGSIYYYQRNYDEAEKHVRVALAIDPNYADAYRYLSAIKEQKKDQAKTIDAAANLLVQSGDPEIASAVRAAPDYTSALKTWAAELEKKSKHAYVPPLDIADVYARLGDREQTFAWLAKAADDRSPGLIWMAVEPRYDAFRSDARFHALLVRLNLADAR